MVIQNAGNMFSAKNLKKAAAEKSAAIKEQSKIDDSYRKTLVDMDKISKAGNFLKNFCIEQGANKSKKEVMNNLQTLVSNRLISVEKYELVDSALSDNPKYDKAA